MINVPTSSIMTTQRDTNDCGSIRRHSAQSRIALQKLSNALPIIALGDFDTFNPVPDTKRRIVIVDGKFPSDDFATHDCSVMSS